MSSITLIRDGRAMTVEDLDHLRRLVDDGVVASTDLALVDDDDDPLSVAELLGSESVHEDEGEAATAGDDPWGAWDGDDEPSVGDLVSGLLAPAVDDGVSVARAVETDAEPGSSRIGMAQPTGVAGRYILGSGGAPSDRLEGPGAEPEQTPRLDVTSGPAPAPARSVSAPSITSTPGGAGHSRPASFVEYVQHKRAVLSPVTIHEAETPTLPPDERRGAPFGFWIAVVTVVATVVATGWYGTIRTGAERQYMTEEQFRSRHLAGGTSASGVETTGGSIVDEPAPDPVALELRYRGEIPIGLQPFQSTEAFKDALFMDLANTGVPVRSILVDAIVTAPGPDPSHRRPEEAHVEVQLAPADAEAADEALAKTALILGHYVADAHVRLRQVVIQTQYDGDVGFAYITHGSAVRELYEGDRRIRAFLDGLERMPQGTYVVEEDAD